jgi:hypothetical protein
VAAAKEGKIVHEGDPSSQLAIHTTLRVEKRLCNPEPFGKTVLNHVGRQLGVNGFSIFIDLFLHVLQRYGSVVFPLGFPENSSFPRTNGAVRVQAGSLVLVVDRLPLRLIYEFVFVADALKQPLLIKSALLKCWLRKNAVPLVVCKFFGPPRIYQTAHSAGGSN